MALLVSPTGKKSDSVCQGCPWFNTGEFVAPVFSTYRRQITVVNESPSVDDFYDSEPCSGERGRILESWLRTCVSGGHKGFELRDSHKLFAVKCCDLEGKKPGIKVVRACAEHLKSDIKYTQKKGSPVVVSLGATATRSFIPVSLFSSLRGQPQEVVFGDSEIVLFPTLSPAHIISRPSEEPLARRDFEGINRLARGESLGTFSSKGITQLHLLSSREKVESFFKIEALEHQVISLDIESTAFDYDLKKVTGNALDYLDSKLLTLNFSFKEGTSHILPLLGYEAKKIWSDVFLDSIGAMIRDLLESPKILFVLHNSGFDLPFLVHNFQINLERVRYVDTLLMSHLLAEEAPKDLKTLATLYTDLGGYESVLSK